MSAVLDNTDLPDGAEELLEALRTMTHTEQLLVACDFDGTLAPFVDDPEKALPLPAAHQAMVDIAQLPQTTFALVSGRDVAGLRRLAAPPREVVLIGSHGAEIAGPLSASIDLAPEQSSALAAVTRELEAVADEHPGSQVEYKPAGVALHTRRLDAESAARAERAAHDRGLAAAEGLMVRDGKRAVEFSATSVTKGDALREIVDALGVSATFFAGDDVTDEDAFAVLGPDDVGLKVGSGPTVAPFRVADLDQMARVLQFVAAERAADVC